MNAAIRAVVRTGIDQGLSAYGVRRGFAGLVEGDWRELLPRDVGGILQTGGTILGSSRCPEFADPAVRRRAITRLREAGIDGLVVIGGNGSQAGSLALTRDGFPTVGIASTIDNDLSGVDITLGVDTALNIALEAIDRLKNTASSHRRAFLVEVMGRHCGYLALMAGIAGGAEATVLPEFPLQPDELARVISEAYARGKPHALVVVAEGSNLDASELQVHFKTNRDRLGFDLRATILGHVQRGGNPTAFDRILATRMGWLAVRTLRNGSAGQLVGLVAGKLAAIPLEEVCGRTKALDPQLLELAKAMTI
jgi:6-phosphofructokinase 1